VEVIVTLAKETQDRVSLGGVKEQMFLHQKRMCLLKISKLGLQMALFLIVAYCASPCFTAAKRISVTQL